MAESRPEDADLEAAEFIAADEPEGLREAIARGNQTIAQETEQGPEGEVEDQPQRLDPEDYLNELMQMSEKEVRALDYEPEVITALIAARRSGLRQADYSRKSAQREQEYKKKLAELEDLRKQLIAAPVQQQQQQSEFDYGEWYQSYVNTHGTEPTTEEALNAIAEFAQRKAIRAVEKRTAPYLTTIQKKQQEMEIEALTKEFPEIAETPDTLSTIMEGVNEAIEELGISGKPGAIRAAFMAKFGDAIMNYRVENAVSTRNNQAFRSKPQLAPGRSVSAGGIPDTSNIEELVRAGAKQAFRRRRK